MLITRLLEQGTGGLTTQRTPSTRLLSWISAGALRVQDVIQLIAATPATLTGHRDRAIILTAVLTGLRREELINLTVGDLSLDDDTPMYRARTKGGKPRYRELPGPAWDTITTYLADDGRPLGTPDLPDQLTDALREPPSLRESDRDRGPHDSHPLAHGS